MSYTPNNEPPLDPPVDPADETYAEDWVEVIFRLGADDAAADEDDLWAWDGEPLYVYATLDGGVLEVSDVLYTGIRPELQGVDFQIDDLNETTLADIRAALLGLADEENEG